MGALTATKSASTVEPEISPESGPKPAAGWPADGVAVRASGAKKASMKTTMSRLTWGEVRVRRVRVRRVTVRRVRGRVRVTG